MGCFKVALFLRIMFNFKTFEPSSTDNLLYQTLHFKGDEAVFILLDYSAAFDTSNHTIFLKRLENRYGITGKALNWFTSHLKIALNQLQLMTLFQIHVCHWRGCRKGPSSVLCIHLHIEDIIESRGFGKMIYADDTKYLLL